MAGYEVGVPIDELLDMGPKFAGTVSKMKISMLAFAMKIAAPLLPHLRDFAGQLDALTKREDFISFIQRAVDAFGRQLVNAIEKVNKRWPDIEKSIEDVTNVITPIYEAIRGLWGAFFEFLPLGDETTSLFKDMLPSIEGIEDPAERLGTMLGGLAVVGATLGPILSFAMLMFGALQAPILLVSILCQTLATIFGGLAVAIGGTLAFFGPLIATVGLAAAKITLIIGAIVGLVAGIVALIGYLMVTDKSFRKYVIDVIKAVIDIVGTMLGSLDDLFSMLTAGVRPMSALKFAAKAVVAVFAGFIIVLGGVVTAIGAVITIIASLLSWIVKLIEEGVERLTGAFDWFVEKLVGRSWVDEMSVGISNFVNQGIEDFERLDTATRRILLGAPVFAPAGAGAVTNYVDVAITLNVEHLATEVDVDELTTQIDRKLRQTLVGT